MNKKNGGNHLFGVLIVYLLLFSAFFVLLEKKGEEEMIEPQGDGLLVHVKRNEGDIEIPLEEYIVGVVASEMPASFELEALKAQCVASRSFVVSRGLVVDDSTASQVYKSEEELRSRFKGEYESRISKVRKAVEATRGEVMYYEQKVINALFFSTSNGETVNSQDYYTATVPYLQAVNSEWDLDINDNAISEVFYSFEDIRKLLSCKGEVNISVISRYENHRVKKVKVNDKEYSGRELRELLGLRSNDFTVIKNDKGFTFKTIGFGHGVGMSQYGAQGMALEGYSYIDILKHYYKGVEIQQLS